ncbi:MAG: sigma-70 family RNA polymerase sigma factor [Nocardioides sp.]
MSVSLSRVDGPGDAELISAVRGGDLDAYGELFARHVDAARRLARQLAGPGDSDDLVSDAFAKVLAVLQRGGGPDLAFRAYLLTAVRRLHVDRLRSGSRLRPVDDLEPFDPGLPFHDTAVEGFDNAAAARAFASLPERWQMVLWHTEVEQQKPADIAPLLGMSANSVSALAYRAREGLRQAFLSQHAADPDDVDCAWTRDHLGAYIRGGLSRRDTARVDEHLESCRACAAVYLELNEVNSGLAALIAPLLLGTAGVAYYSSFGVHGGAGASAAWTATKSFLGGHTAVTAVGGVLLTAAASVAIYVGAHAVLAHDVNTAGDGGLQHPPSHTATHPGHGKGHGKHHGKGHHDTKHPQTPSGGPSSLPSVPVTGTTSTPASPATSDTTAPTSPPTTQPTSQPTGGTITFDSTPPVDPAFGDTYRVKASSDSGGDITFTIDDATTHQACSIDGSTVTFDHAGTCVIDADLAGSRSALASPSRAQQQVTVPKENPKIVFTLPATGAVGTGDDLTATSNSDGQITFAIDPAITTCLLDGSTVHYQHVGACVVTATQAASSDYVPGTATRTVTVDPGRQDVTFISTPPNDPAFGDTYTVSATSTSGGAIGFAVDPSTDGYATDRQACAVSDPDPTDTSATVTFDHAGACLIDASQAGTADYHPATTAEPQRVDVPKAKQLVTFTTTAPNDPAFGDTYTVGATSTSGGAIGFAVDPSTDGYATDRQACAVSDPDPTDTSAIVTFDHAGACLIDAGQAGTADYRPATTAEPQRVDVPKAAQSIRFTSTIPTGAVVDGTIYTVNARGGDSGEPVTFSVDPSTTNDACSLEKDGQTVRWDHVGTCVIAADQAGNHDYLPANTQRLSVEVGQGSPTIGFTLPATGTVGTSDQLSATSNSDGAFTFAVDPATTNNACDLNPAGTEVRYQHVGDCVVTATQAASTDYLSGTATRTVSVYGATHDLWISATVSDAPPTPWDRHWHEVDVTVHDLAIDSTATVTGSADKRNVLVVPQFDCWFQVDGVCHVKSPPTDSLVEFFVWLPDGTHSAQVTFQVASPDSPDPDPSNDSVSVTVSEFNAQR